MTLVSKFKKDLQTLKGASDGDFFLDVKNPKLYKKIKRFYKEDVLLTGEDPEYDYNLLLECIRQDL